MIKELKKDLQKYASKEKAKIFQRFFKTGKGEYGEGDIFIGLTVPESRSIAKKYSEIEFFELQELLQSKIHEERLVALLILVDKYKHSKDLKAKKQIYDFYIKNTAYINNWDLVDLSASRISGQYILDSNDSNARKQLYIFAKSKNLWERRIAIISTFQFIYYNTFDDTLKISEILLTDKHDLIHKAVGWMLRELGKRNQSLEEEFLKKYYKTMPRTMLRYSIEKFDEKKRKFYMEK